MITKENIIVLKRYKSQLKDNVMVCLQVTQGAQTQWRNEVREMGRKRQVDPLPWEQLLVFYNLTEFEVPFKGTLRKGPWTLPEPPGSSETRRFLAYSNLHPPISVS